MHGQQNIKNGEVLLVNNIPFKFCFLLRMLQGILLYWRSSLQYHSGVSPSTHHLSDPSNVSSYSKFLLLTTRGGHTPRQILQLRKALTRHRCNSGRITTSMTASTTLLLLRVMSPSCSKKKKKNP